MCGFTYLTRKKHVKLSLRASLNSKLVKGLVSSAFSRFFRQCLDF